MTDQFYFTINLETGSNEPDGLPIPPRRETTVAERFYAAEQHVKTVINTLMTIEADSGPVAEVYPKFVQRVTAAADKITGLPETQHASLNVAVRSMTAILGEAIALAPTICAADMLSLLGDLSRNLAVTGWAYEVIDDRA